MVAKIKSGKSLTGALHYNENKVKDGKAKLLDAPGYAKDPWLLSFKDKLFRLKDLAERNQLTRTNTVHISLNFDVGENPGREKLISIAGDYMSRIGFGNQPYLIYQHFDAGHPHVHILSTNIRPDGERISLHNIGRDVSEPARKAIEITYGLIQAGSKLKNESLPKGMPKPLIYGSTDTKRIISNIINEVTRNYKFTSIPELNAVLCSFNVLADRGSLKSTMFKNNGLLYWALDMIGQKQGVPIKASGLPNKPTLKTLDKRFKLNSYLRKPFRELCQKKIDQAIKSSVNKDDFIDNLKEQQIQVLFRQNAEGRIYGTTFIDHAYKVVFNGSDLGKNYAANTIAEALDLRCAKKGLDFLTWPFNAAEQQSYYAFSNPIFNQAPSLLDDLLNPYGQNPSVPNEFGQRKKKKRRKKLNL